MDVNFNSVFDFNRITQGCWKICDSDNGINTYKGDPYIFPSYRDKSTEADFLEVAQFFGCVDICQSTNESKRLALLFPIGLGGLVIAILLACLLCYFCKCRKRRKPLMINILDDSNSFFASSTTSSTAGIISDFRKPLSFAGINF